MMKKIKVSVAVLVLALILGAVPAFAEIGSVRNGDYNGNGVVNVCDLIFLKKYLLSPQTPKASEEDVISGDTDTHVVSVSDLVALRKYLLGDDKAFEDLFRESVIVF